MTSGGVNIFHFNCSTPPEGVNFVLNPAVRGTLDIVWSCLGIIILSTWHGSVLIQREIVEHDPGRSVWKFLRDGGIRFLTFFLGVLAPEMMCGSSFQLFAEARGVYQAGIPYALEDGVDWDMMKALYAVWSGFVIRFDRTKYKINPPITTSEQIALPRDWDAPKTDVVESTTELLTETSTADDATVEKRITLEGKHLLYLRKVGVLDKLPVLSVAELKDRNKSDSLLEALALTQTTWLIVQVIVRFRKGLSVTLLEVVTLAFAVLNLVTRMFDWKRAKDVHMTTVVYATREITPKEREAMYQFELPKFKWYGIDGNILFLLISTVVGAIFGGIHCSAWHEQFPTAVERTLWRITAVVTAIVPGFYIMLAEWYFAGYVSLRDWFLPLFMVIYVLARLYIIVETIRSLFYAPPGAFVATWTVNFPYFG